MQRYPEPIYFYSSWPGNSSLLCADYVNLSALPAIHVFGAAREEDVDARVKPGHDGGESCSYSAALFAALANFFMTRSRFSLDR